mmetsp:Transcript_17242/g.53448  ORF Transcript_17242/g.53448 Transcript_17242/m.53448 type:complete len:960 (+) Transcript_17242:82-2961(+)|eukprot:CAMPEP_0185178184 /NCGR_PEP_ID=MMETSP1139-20130426/30837_1 /TAXON_ID=298111 /ORGANISM="Pavlova sp., Strain CCMP459" /LENGTH=959 /DNA_ID=CAMNT_0027743997 /DNA_START=1 /DNA_END=2880 /DNA_ORIENTATION=+
MNKRFLIGLGIIAVCAQFYFFHASTSQRPSITGSRAEDTKLHATLSSVMTSAGRGPHGAAARPKQASYAGEPAAEWPAMAKGEASRHSAEQTTLADPRAGTVRNNSSPRAGMAQEGGLGAPGTGVLAASATRQGARFGSVQLPPAPAALTVAFANSAMEAYAVNWLLHVKAVAALHPYLLVSLDEEMHQVCDRMGFPAVRAADLHRDPSLVLEHRRGPRGYVRNDPAEFKKLGKVKALFTVQLLELGYDVLLSDVDSVWLADPWPYLGGAATPSLATADLLVTNDYSDWSRDVDQTTVFNTGALLLRAGPRAIAFVKEWANRTERTGLIGNDQTELNRLLVGQYRDGDYSCTIPDCLERRKPHVAALLAFAPLATAAFAAASAGKADVRTPCPEGQPAGSQAASAPACVWKAVPGAMDASRNLSVVHVQTAQRDLDAFAARQRALGRAPVPQQRVPYWMWGGRVRAGLLPMAHFLQGHTYFLQHLHVQLGTEPVHVHVTYTNAGDFGKRFRLRSAGLWQAEAPEHYSRGNLLHVVGMRDAVLALLRAQTFPAAVWSCSEGEPVSPIFDNTTLKDLSFLARPDTSAAWDRMAGALQAQTPAESGAGMGAPPGGQGGGGSGRGGRGLAPPMTRTEANARLCYHPTHFVPSLSGADALAADYEHMADPATPNVRLQYLQRIVLRNALALAAQLGRRLVLPSVWCMCDRYWWHLKDCRMPGSERLPMPFECPMDLAFNIDDWQRLSQGRVEFVEGSFLDNPQTDPAIKASRVHSIRIARDVKAGDDDLPDTDRDLGARGEAQASSDHVTAVSSGSTLEEVGQAVAQSQQAVGSRVLRVSASSLLRLAPCGAREVNTRRALERDILQAAFGGQHSYCSSERNPHLGIVLEDSRRRGLPDEPTLLMRRNCTGNPANSFNKPKVDLGPSALAFADECNAAKLFGGKSPAAAHLAAAIQLNEMKPNN